MNVYNKATGWGAFITLVLLVGVLVFDVWLMGQFSVLQHGLAYALLQIAMLAVLLTLLRLIFKDGSASAKN